MNENKDILLKLLGAGNSEEVEAIINSEDFFKNVKWVAYGDNPNNAGQIDQMHEPENALIEKISNSIDSVLMRKCQEEGIDPRDKDKAPKSMSDAINRYFGGKNELRKKRSEIAKELLRLTAEGKKERPTITIIDNGEGQTPERIKETILSLNKDIKEKIRFVYGTYNKGGASALGFAGPNKYDVNYLQLVLSKRASTINENKKFQNDEHFGFTIIRKRFDNLSSKWTYEYFVDSSGRTYSFKETFIDIKGFKFYEGCVIKLYDYQLKTPGNIVFRGLNEIIEKKMPDSPLPIYLSELRDYKGDRNYTIFGLREKLERKKELLYESYPQKLPVDLGEIGKRDIEVFVLNHKSNAQGDIGSYLDEKERIFFIKDGLVLHTENISWIRNECNLPDLAPYLFLFVDISIIVPALAQMLHSGREKFKNNETTRLALQRLQLFLGADVFKKIDEIYGNLSAGETSTDDTELKKQLAKDIENQPELREFFDIGDQIATKKEEKGEDDEKSKYHGDYLPNKFELIGENPKDVEEKSYCKVTFDIGAEDEFFSRTEGRGEYDWSKSDKFYVSMYSFNKGKLIFRIDPGEKAQFGVEEKIIFFLKVPSKNINFDKEVGFVLRPKSPYLGKDYPTFFEFRRKKFLLPIGESKTMSIHTDANDNYFDNTGKINLEKRSDIDFGRVHLKEGVLKIKIKSLKKKLGELNKIKIKISDSQRNFDLKIPLEIIPTGTNPDLKLPILDKISKEKWDVDSPPWSENIVARIPSWKELKKIKVNTDSLPFQQLRESKLTDRDIAREVLIRNIYLGSIWNFLELKDLDIEQDLKEEIFEKTMKATSKYILQNIKRLMR